MYLCIAACACLMKYVEHVQSMTFASQSLRVEFKTLHGIVKLDIQTVKNLEIVTSRFSSSKGKSSSKQSTSLFTFLSHCVTPSGKRLLRNTLLQPLNDRPTIELRLDTVQELVEHESLFFELKQALATITIDLDALNASLVKVPKEESQRAAQSVMKNLLLLKFILSRLGAITSAASKCESVLMKTIAQNLQASENGEIVAAITRVLSPDAAIVRKDAGHIRSQLVFAVKPGVSHLLDVARAIYLEVIEEIDAETQRYRLDLDCPDIQIRFTATRGYHLSIPPDIVLVDDTTAHHKRHDMSREIMNAITQIQVRQSFQRLQV
jgi:DNA mismatch repair protein MSH4